MLATALNIAGAQPVVTDANFSPVIGQSFTLHNSTPTSLNPGSSGASVTWNFASMPNQNTVTFTEVTPASTTYGANFPTANVATFQNQVYDFNHSNTNSYSVSGYVFGTLVFPYTDEKTIITYPFSYASTFTDPYAGSYTTGATVYQTGIVTGTADGYGTLILPWGTVTDVLRLRLQTIYQDSSAGFINNYVGDSYTWIKPGTHYYLCNMASVTANGASTTYSAGYLDAGSMGIDVVDPGEIDFSAYPNAATDFLTVKFNLKTAAKTLLTVTNTVGQKIYSSGEVMRNGNYSGTIDVSSFAAGVYFLNLNLDDRILSTKFVVKK